MSARSAGQFAASLVGRSFFPFAALVILAGTIAWGPWVSLVLAVALWRTVARYG